MVLLHPGALLILLLLVPLAVVEWRRIGRERRAARAIGLEPQRLWLALQRGVCAGLVIALVVFAASEPATGQTKKAQVRADAEAYLFVDASASMFASASRSRRRGCSRRARRQPSSHGTCRPICRSARERYRSRRCR